MTGAQVPEGADAVVMMEMTESKVENGEQWIALKRHILSGANITPIGLEVQEGQQLIEAGTVIGAGEQSVLATFGMAEVPVFNVQRWRYLQPARNCLMSMSHYNQVGFGTATVTCCALWLLKQVESL